MLLRPKLGSQFTEETSNDQHNKDLASEPEWCGVRVHEDTLQTSWMWTTYDRSCFSFVFNYKLIHATLTINYYI